jgi:hypothetical protein
MAKLPVFGLLAITAEIRISRISVSRLTELCCNNNKELGSSR